LQQPGWTLGWLCATVRARPQRRAFLLLMHMDDFLYTKVDNTKLSPWYFGVSWAAMMLQQKVASLEERGLNANYDIRQLQQLQDLEQFLKMSWDVWMDGIERRQTAQEVQ
jgi:hypothetical protein